MCLALTSMANLKPHKFTQEERIKGGKMAKMKRLNINRINSIMQQYIDGDSLKENLKITFLDDLLTLSPKDRINFLMAWMPYERPKLQTVEQIIEVSGNIDMSREEREEKILKLLKTGT